MATGYVFGNPGQRKGRDITGLTTSMPLLKLPIR
jgi:hypothetical protein